MSVPGSVVDLDTNQSEITVESTIPDEKKKKKSKKHETDDSGSEKRSKSRSKKKNDKKSRSKESKKKLKEKKSKDKSKEKKKQEKGETPEVNDIGVEPIQCLDDEKSKAQFGTEEVRNPPNCDPRIFGPCKVDIAETQTAILMLQATEDNVIIKAFKCLEKFCKRMKENREIVFDQGVTNVIRPMLFHKNVEIQTYAIEIMALTCQTHKAQLYLRDLEIAGDLLKLAKSNVPAIVKFSTIVLNNLTKLYTGRLQVIHAEGIPILVFQISHQDSDVQKNCLKTLWHILEEPLHIELLTIKASLIPILLAIKSENAKVRIVALSIIEKITSQPIGIEVLESTDLILVLTERLEFSKNKEDCDKCENLMYIKILINMGNSSNASQIMVGVLGTAIEMLDTNYKVQPSDPVLISLLLSLIGKLATIKEFGPQLLEIGMGGRLINFLNDPDVEVKEAACLAISNFAETNHKAKIQLIGAIKLLIDFGRTKIRDSLLEYILLALGSIMKGDHEANKEFVEYKGLASLKVILLEKKTDNAVISALSILSNMLYYALFRTHAIDEDLVITIQSCFNHPNPRVLTMGICALLPLLSDETGLDEFFTYNGCNDIIQLLNHTEYPVVVSIAQIIQVLANNTNAANKLIEKGVLQEIWKKKDLIGKSGILRIPFETLLDQDLSMKFAIDGHISPFQKLQNGFYDIGKISCSGAFIPLIDISRDRNRTNEKEKEDLRMQILYLNITPNSDESLMAKNQVLQFINLENQSLMELVENIHSMAEESSIFSEKGLVKIIAKAVCQKFGGVLDKWRVGAQGEEIEIANIQNKFDSAIVPVSLLRSGGYRPRAMVFKAMADIFGIPASLERGEHKKCWNVVFLSSDTKENRKTGACVCMSGPESGKQSLLYEQSFQKFVVDLIYEPGTLFPITSKEANAYCLF